MKICVLVAVLLLMPPPHPDVLKPCRCAEAKVHNGWCRRGAVGYVAGLKLKSHLLFEELDAHGHNIDPSKIECESCQQAMAIDGFCDRCQYGYVNKQLYFSRLSYYLAKGQPTKPAAMRCPTCTKNTDKYGWCPKCRTGMVGPFAYKNRDYFDQACVEYERLRSAVKISGKCEMCAVVMFTGGPCPRCKKVPMVGTVPPDTKPTTQPVDQQNKSTLKKQPGVHETRTPG